MNATLDHVERPPMCPNGRDAEGDGNWTRMGDRDDRYRHPSLPASREAYIVSLVVHGRRDVDGYGGRHPYPDEV
jgi:hypothetical protein